MKQFQHKKLVLIAASAVTFTVLILYLWAGAFVLRIFPRNEPADTAQSSNSTTYNNEINPENYRTLSEVDEKPEPIPNSDGAAAANTPGNSAEHLQSNANKTNPGKRRGLLQILFGN